MHAQQQTHVVHHVAAAQPGCCGVPKEASCAVTGTRVCAILAIIIHAVDLMFWGWLSIATWIASLIAFIMCGILLCVYAQCTYIVCPIFFLIAAAFDGWTLWFWYLVYQGEIAYYGGLYFDNGTILWLMLPSALGTITLLLAALFGFASACSWVDAPTGGGSTVISSVPDAHVQGPSNTVTTAHPVQPTSHSKYREEHYHDPEAPPRRQPPRRQPPPAYDSY